MAIAGGGHFTVLLTERAGLLVFGSNSHGNLGRPLRESHVEPTLLGGVGGAAGDAVRELPGGMQVALALAQIEGALGAPRQDPAENHLFDDEAVVMVATGQHYTVCVTDSGAVFATGENGCGQLGLGDEIRRSSFTTLGPDVFNGAPAMMLACGASHTLVLTRAGFVWAFGAGANGENGSPGLQTLSAPALVAGLAGIVMVAAGVAHSVAVGADGSLWTWGSSHSGALGHDDAGDGAMATPRVLSPPAFGGHAVLFVAAGYSYTTAVTASGGLWAWGAGAAGQLGLGDVADRRVPTWLTSTWGGSRVRMVSCGGSVPSLQCVAQTMAATEDGAVWTWGSPRVGQLGHNDALRRLTPTRIPQAAFGGARIVLVYNTFGNASMAVTMHGLVYQWGSVATGHRLGGPAVSLRPVLLGTSVSPGGRCGRGCALPRRDVLAFAQGTHARLGDGCVFREMVLELVRAIDEQAQAPRGAYAHMREGQLRLLAATVRVT